jgi:hypothetical protein
VRVDKYDIKKEFKSLYSAGVADFELVDVPEFSYIAIDGNGDPNTSAEYVAAIESLYATAYVLKFASKASGRDFVVGPLEGLWRADDMTVFARGDKNQWGWTMMIVQPPWITPEHVARAVAHAAAKKQLSSLAKLRLLRMVEGECAQILHIGTYANEAPTLKRLHEQYLPARHVRPSGDHHEIYLSDPRRTAPEKLKTILRQPVEPVETVDSGVAHSS